MARDEPYRSAEMRIEAARRSGATEADLRSAFLDRSKDRIAKLLESLAQLGQLQTLDLSHNQLTALPESLGQLTELQTLDLGHNQLTKLPEWLGQLTQLQTLNLGHNQLTELPEWLGQLTQLQTLNLGLNQLTVLPESLGQLTQLQTLDIDANQLTELPESLGDLTQLRELRFFLNSLTVLPESFRQLTNLSTLVLMGNDGLNIPPEIVSDWQNGAQRILAYYFQLQEQSRQLLEAKILVVGQGAVGKTSLTKVLLGRPFDPLETTTHGINIGVWTIPREMNEDWDTDHLRVNLWDFGGQEIMHATHQFFLTKRSLYLLVLDSRKGENERNLHFWLKIIQSYGGDSPVLVVINKCDEFRMDLNERRIQLDYAPNIKGFFHVSAKTGDGIENLRKAIEGQIRHLPHVFDKLPQAYFDVKKQLEERASTQDFVDAADYETICRNSGVTESESQSTLIRFLHDLGTVLNFNDPTDPYELQDTNILNPEWVTGAVYKIINSASLMQREGELELQMLGRILNDPERYPASRYRFIIDVMCKFELCFVFPASDGNRFLIPELLSVREPDLKWDDSETLKFQYQYSVLPSGLICRLIVRNARYLGSPPVYWRSGVILQIGSNSCLVRSDINRNTIFISIAGPIRTRREALERIRAECDHVHRTIPRLEVSGKVPLPDNPEVLVDYAHLHRLKDMAVERFIPEGAAAQYDVVELLTGIQPAQTDEPQTLYVHRLVLENIRCFKRLELDFRREDRFRPLTMLLGDNGVGKTTVLRSLALALCDESSAASLIDVLAGGMLRADCDVGTITVECGTHDLHPDTWSLQTRFTRKRGNVVELTQEIPDNTPLDRVFACGYGALRRGFGTQSPQRYEVRDSVRTLFDYNATLQNPELVFRRIAAAGHNINNLLERIGDILLLGKNAARIDGTGIHITGPWGTFLPVGAIGDGYQATLAWLVDFFGWALFYDERFSQRTFSGVVLIDEIEKHLHPRWQRQIIRELHKQFPLLQFIVTSHSPICAGGVADLEDGDGGIYSLSLDNEQPLKIDPPAGWRYDQIVTSAAFGLMCARDTTTESMLNRLRELYERHGEDAHSSPEFQNAMAELESRSVMAAEDELDRQNRQDLANELRAVQELLGKGTR